MQPSALLSATVGPERGKKKSIDFSIDSRGSVHVSWMFGGNSRLRGIRGYPWEFMGSIDINRCSMDFRESFVLVIFFVFDKITLFVCPKLHFSGILTDVHRF